MKLALSETRSTSVAALFDVVLPTLAFLAVLISFVIVAVSSTNELSVGDQFSCAANGEPVLPDDSITTWNHRLFFSISLAYGDFSFNTAKTIDVLWDLLVGRGGQLLLSVMIYPVLRRSVLTSLEQSAWAVPMLTKLTFDPFSLNCLATTCRECICYRKPRRLLLYLYIIFYILAFNTIVSAMTGYRTTLTPYYRPPGTEDLMAANDLNLKQIPTLLLTNTTDKAVTVVLADSSYDLARPMYRNWTKGAPRIAIPPNEKCYNSFRYYMDLKSRCQTWLDERPLPNANLSESFKCPPLDDEDTELASIGYTYTLRTNGKREATMTNVNMTIGNQTYNLGNIRLNIVQDQLPTTLYWQDSKTKTVTDATGLRDNTSCQTGKTYQWGFSFQILVVLGFLTILFSLAVLILLFDAHLHSRLNQYVPQFSIYSDILDLAAEIRTEFKIEAGDLSPSALNGRIKNGLGTTRIENIDEYPISRRHRRQGVREKRVQGMGGTLRQEIALTKLSDIHHIDELEEHRLLPPIELQRRLDERLSTRLN